MKANRWKAYFNFSRKERVGIVALLIIIFLLWLAPEFFRWEEDFDPVTYQQFQNDLAQLRQKKIPERLYADTQQAHYSAFTSTAGSDTSRISLFNFDPNSLPPEGWKQLGVPGRTAKTIQNFLAKGGRFRKPGDIGKIYGLREEDYKRLLPYVRIPAPETEQGVREQTQSRKFINSELNHATAKISINSADTTAFIALPGIGYTLAGRIVRFRDKLGGFYSVDQLGEVYGLSDTLLRQIKPYLLCNPDEIKTININVADVAGLKAHPYIKYQIANAVIQYRAQHGRFQEPEDLKKIHLISEAVFQKLKPYIYIDN